MNGIAFLKSMRVQGACPSTPSIWRLTLLCGVGLAGLVPMAAEAQDQVQEQSQGSTEATTPEIVVTAQRRAEDIQSIPLSITAISGDSLQNTNTTGINDILEEVPGVSISYGPQGSYISIRGITSLSGGGEVDPGLAFNTDGVYNPFTTASLMSFYDVERVEVLRGPQGTLYGRNAISGAVNVITKDPVLGDFEGFAQAGAGNYGAATGTLVLNTPLGDDLALRVAGNYQSHDGYLSNGDDDLGVWSVRAKLLFKPTDTISIKLFGDYGKFSGNGLGQVLKPVNPDDPWDVGTNADRVPPNEPFQRDKQYGVGAQVDVDFGFGTLTYIPAYKDSRFDNYAVTAGNLAASHGYDTQWTHELRLSSNSNTPLSWVVGAYYFDAWSELGIAFDPITLIQDVYSKSYAGFGQVTYSVTDRLRLTGGLRFTHDTKRENAVQSSPLSTVTVDGDQSAWSVWNWRAAVEADVSADSMAYASVSTGYKAGGVSLNFGPGATFEPEHLTAYEVGIKNRLFDRRMTLNAEAYYYDYTNYQAIYVDISPALGGPTRMVANAADARVYGGEVELAYAPTDNDFLRLTAAYVNGKFGDYLVPNIASPGIDNNYSDSKFSAPPWQLSGSYQHRFDLPDGGAITPEASVAYRSHRYLDPRVYAVGDPFGTPGAYVTPDSYQGDNAKIDASLTYESPDHKWNVSAYVKNLTNVAAFASAGNVGGVSYGYIEAPRTYGMTVLANF